MADGVRVAVRPLAALLACLTLAAACGAARAQPSASTAAVPTAGESTAAASTASTSTASTSTASTSAAATTAVGTSASVGSGTLRSVTIPATTSGFAARAAELYLPPILRTRPTTRLPVLELLHGTPGSPSDWVSKGAVAATMNAFAATHQGRAPIVVMPDINGTQHGDTECVRTPGGADVEDYLTRDVPAWVTAHLPTLSSPEAWGVAGLSEGGTCAVVLALRSRVFSSFVDLSGLSRPTVGDHDDPAATIAALFGGSRSGYDAHDPLYLLARHRYPQLGGWFTCGASDRGTLPSQRALASASRTAGVSVTSREVPGRHSWAVWRPALQQALPWFWQRAV